MVVFTPMAGMNKWLGEIGVTIGAGGVEVVTEGVGFCVCAAVADDPSITPDNAVADGETCAVVSDRGTGAVSAALFSWLR